MIGIINKAVIVACSWLSTLFVAVGVLIADTELWLKMSFRAVTIHYVLLMMSVVFLVERKQMTF